MERHRILPILRHGVTMVRRKIKSYALLSVTIVLSLSLLLGYVLYTDSSLYNRYKKIFSQRRGDVVIYDTSMNQDKTELFLNNLSEIQDTQYFVEYHGHFGHYDSSFIFCDYPQDQENTIALTNIQFTFLPPNAWLDCALDEWMPQTEITWLDGQNRNFNDLETDQIVMPDQFYYALKLDKLEEPIFVLRSSNGVTMSLRVAGYYHCANSNNLLTREAWDGHNFLASTKLISKADLWAVEMGGGASMIWGQSILIHSAAPEEVVYLAKSMGYDMIRSVYEQQNEALNQIRSEKSNKAIIACALLLLLGINLYSSFTNALNDRKFEIGVKRAIGASAWSIVRQFLYESLLVMAANVFLSVALVADVFIIYKYLYELYPNAWGYYQTWVIYISPHSVAMFGICAVTLTLVFSLIFAYKSTRVEIVQYLKAE